MRRLAALGIACLALSGGLGAAERYLILPFHNASGAANLDWIGEAFAEAAREALEAHGVPVVPRSERERAARRLGLPLDRALLKGSLIRLGMEAQADWIVFGRFEFSPAPGSGEPARGSIHVRAESLDLKRVMAGPVHEEAAPMRELSRLLGRLAWKLLRDARPETAPPMEEFLERHRPVRLDALENYIRGLLAPELEQKHRFFALAANLEPEFALPCFELGRMQWDENNYRAAARWLKRVPPDSSRYLEARFLLGLCRYHVGDYERAREDFEAVADAVPGPAIFNNLALAWYRTMVPNAVEALLWAVDRDPEDPDLRFNAGYLLWREGRFAEAASHLEKALEINPGDVAARRLLLRCRKSEGPRRGDLSMEGAERLKEYFEEVAAAPDRAGRGARR